MNDVYILINIEASNSPIIASITTLKVFIFRLPSVELKTAVCVNEVISYDAYN